MPIKALMLAAGRGSRLGPQTSDLPKPLLQIGTGHLVEHQLSTLANAGIGPVGMVLGYHADDIRDVVGMRAEYLYNGRWATTNSMASFLAAKEWIDDDLIVLNCDVLFHGDVLRRLLSAGPDSFAFDSTSGEGLEHMKVQLDPEGHLVRMSKALDAGDTSGENVGILYFGKSTARRLVEIAERRIEQGHTKDWLGSAVQELCRERPLKGVDVAGCPWVEIDFAYDLDRARKEVYPFLAPRHRAWPRRLGYAAAALLMVVVMGLVAGLAAVQGHGSAGSESTVLMEVIPLRGGTRTTLDNRSAHQTWWIVDNGESVAADIEGPAQIHVESRLVLDRDSSATSPYLLEITVDRDVIDWIRPDLERSRSIRFEGGRVGKRSREMIEIGAGSHRLRILASLVAERRVLLRLRQVEPDFSDD